MLLPLIAIPLAIKFLIVRYVCKIATDGTKKVAASSSTVMLCARMNCQYSYSRHHAKEEQETANEDEGLGSNLLRRGSSGDTNDEEGTH